MASSTNNRQLFLIEQFRTLVGRCDSFFMLYLQNQETKIKFDNQNENSNTKKSNELKDFNLMLYAKADFSEYINKIIQQNIKKTIDERHQDDIRELESQLENFTKEKQRNETQARTSEEIEKAKRFLVIEYEAKLAQLKTITHKIDDKLIFLRNNFKLSTDLIKEDTVFAMQKFSRATDKIRDNIVNDQSVNSHMIDNMKYEINYNAFLNDLDTHIQNNPSTLNIHNYDKEISAFITTFVNDNYVQESAAIKEKLISHLEVDLKARMLQEREFQEFIEILQTKDKHITEASIIKAEITFYEKFKSEIALVTKACQQGLEAAKSATLLTDAKLQDAIVSLDTITDRIDQLYVASACADDFLQLTSENFEMLPNLDLDMDGGLNLDLNSDLLDLDADRVKISSLVPTPVLATSHGGPEVIHDADRNENQLKNNSEEQKAENKTNVNNNPDTFSIYKNLKIEPDVIKDNINSKDESIKSKSKNKPNNKKDYEFQTPSPSSEPENSPSSPRFRK